jgi:hypothetical protein
MITSAVRASAPCRRRQQPAATPQDQAHPGLHPQHVERLAAYWGEAQDLAVTFLSMVEGAALLANNLRDPELLSRQIYRLEQWMDSLADR